MRLVVGLGNPGRKYALTRHNLGVILLQKVADSLNVSIDKNLTFSCYGISRKFGGIILAKSALYMNQSGVAVAQLFRKFHISSNDFILLHDDLDLDFSKIKIKKSGGAGGHKGVESTISSIGTDEFIRLRLGIGKPSIGQDPADYVLSKFYEEEKEILDNFLNFTIQATIEILSNGPDFAMNKYNRRLRLNHNLGFPE
ncbi:MAG TPA: aminoacyl-tRNA hydrolase [bacterium]